MERYRMPGIFVNWVYVAKHLVVEAELGYPFQAFLDSGAQQQLYQKDVLSILNYVSYKKSDLCQIPSIDKTTFQSVMSWCVHVTHPLWLKEGGMKISFHQIQNIDSLEISHLCPSQHGFQVSYELLLVL
uniref:Uncharacterized protein n=1 Tax=Fagus sylvatica TaxID=28930 RepID=A0A2N9EJ53_FAGSY